MDIRSTHKHSNRLKTLQIWKFFPSNHQDKIAYTNRPTDGTFTKENCIAHNLYATIAHSRQWHSALNTKFHEQEYCTIIRGISCLFQQKKLQLLYIAKAHHQLNNQISCTMHTDVFSIHQSSDKKKRNTKIPQIGKQNEKIGLRMLVKEVTNVIRNNLGISSLLRNQNLLIQRCCKLKSSRTKEIHQLSVNYKDSLQAHYSTYPTVTVYDGPLWAFKTHRRPT